MTRYRGPIAAARTNSAWFSLGCFPRLHGAKTPLAVSKQWLCPNPDDCYSAKRQGSSARRLLRPRPVVLVGAFAFTTFHTHVCRVLCVDQPLRLQAPVLLDAEPDVGCPQYVVTAHARRSGGLVGIARYVRIYPIPRLRIHSQRVRDRNHNVVVRHWQHNIADFRYSAVILAHVRHAGKSPCDHVALYRKSGELIDGIGNCPQPEEHVPLVGQDESGAARADGSGVGHRNSDHWTFRAIEGIDNGKPSFGCVGLRIPHSDLRVESASQPVKHLDCLHSSLTVADDQRPYAVMFVVPRDLAGEALAAPVGTLQVRTVNWIADLRAGVAHTLQKGRKRGHDQVDRIDTGMHQYDSRGGPSGQC